MRIELAYNIIISKLGHNPLKKKKKCLKVMNHDVFLSRLLKAFNSHSAGKVSYWISVMLCNMSPLASVKFTLFDPWLSPFKELSKFKKKIIDVSVLIERMQKFLGVELFLKCKIVKKNYLYFLKRRLFSFFISSYYLQF